MAQRALKRHTIARNQADHYFGSRTAAKKAVTKPVDPIQIYSELDRAHDKGPLRPSQEAVL